ncbi:MAG TPA: hypothetical protein VF286_05100 [Acidiphilium sp.]
MSNAAKIVALAIVLTFALLLAVVVTDYAPWYFAWMVGTVMIILIAASGAVMFETQEAAKAAKSASTEEKSS